MAFPATEQEHRLRSLMAEGSTRLSLRVLAATGDATAGGGRRGGRRPAERPLHPLRRQPGRPAPALAGRAGHLGHPAGGVGGVPVRLPPAQRPAGRRGREPRRRAADHAARQGVARPRGPRRSSSARCSSRPSADQPRPERTLVGGRSGPHGGDRRAGVRPSTRLEGLTGRPIFWRQDKKRILADLLRFLQEDSDARRTRRHPARWPPSWPSGCPARTWAPSRSTCPMGAACSSGARPTESMSAADGTLHVVDYKTGKADDYRDLSEDNPDAQGRRLQLPVYGQAARLRPGDPGRAGAGRVLVRLGPGRLRPRRVLGHARGAGARRGNPRDRRGGHRGGGLSRITRPHRARRPGSSARSAIPTAWG